MKILIDFFPILLFVGAYKLYDIYVGTAVLMAATVLQVAIMYRVDRLSLPCTRSHWPWC
jgi:intracellular septation protein